MVESLKSEGHYLKPPEAAHYLGSSVSTLAKRRLYGSGPRYYRLGRAIRYLKADLDEFMAVTKATSTSQAGEP